MKNLFRILMAAAVLLTASCAKEDISSTIGGGEVEVTFTANLAGLGTRAIADGNTVDRVYLAIFDAKADTYLGELTADAGYPVSNGQATIPVVLLKDKEYDLVFWAQKDGTGAYTLDLENRQVKANYGVDHSNNFEAWSNNEERDAFFNISNDWTAGKDATTFVLNRPFAQINVGNSDADVKYAKQNGSVITKSAMTVTTKVYDTIELVNGSLIGNEVSAEFVLRDIPTETIKDTVDPTHDATLNASAEYNYLAMNYLLVDDRQLVDLVFKFTDGATTFERKYYQVPVQRNYRTNILGQIISSPMDFTVVIDPVFNDSDENLDAQTQTFKVSTADELAAALTTKVEKHIENLEIILLNDIDLPISSLGQQTGGSGEYKVGTADTDNITIDLNGNKLNITTTYWSALGAKNDNALFTIKNGTMTSSQATGTWNSYDLTFANCNYAIEDVVFEKAVAFSNAGKNVNLKGITINETHDYYAMWICAEGQNVNIDGLTINSAGRGIKIDDEYVDAPAKVTLNIANAAFTTANKAAIMVKSAAGAKINASNLDIANVAADKVYAVWVDEDAAAYYDLVEVTGALVRLEGSVIANTADVLASALTNAEKKYINVILANDIDLPITSLGTITGGSGEYKLGGANTKEITIDLNGKKLNITTTYWSALGAKNDNALFTIKNGAMTSTGNSAGTWNAWDLRFSNCDYVFESVAFEKAVALDNAGKSVIMTDVTITDTHNTDTYGLWITAEGQTVTLENCVIDMLPASDGRGIKIDEQYVSSPAKVILNVSNTTFKTEEKAAILVKSKAGAEINASNLDITGVVADQTFAVWVDSDAKEHAAKVVVNGANVKVEGTVVDLVEVSSVAALKSALIDAGNAGAGNTIIDLAGGEYTMPSDWTPITVDGYHGADIVTINGNGSVLKGMTSSLFNGGFAGGSGIVIKDLTIEDATIVANNTQGYGAFVNCADSMNEITLINCHLINSTIITPNDGNDESRMGGLVGWTSGYSNVNDGPVKTYVNIKECSVVGCTLKGFGSIGGICGHAGANDWTYTTIENCTVKNNNLISTDDGSWRVGVAVGTANVGEVVVKNLTESGNTLTQRSLVAPTGVRSYVGRLSLGTTGSFVVDGVAITE